MSDAAITPDRSATWAVGLVVALTLVRGTALFLSPIELYPDEAQYWTWSRELAWGYFSKPPMIAWLIAASTALGGNEEPWVRLPALLLEGGAAIAVFAAARRLYGAGAGLWACVLYTLAPAVQLSSGVMSTDAPMLFFLGLALWAYAVLRTRKDGSGVVAALGLGAALGLAMLSKYAALYFVVGLALDAVFNREARRAWSRPALAAVAGVALVVIAPNLIWNAGNGFATVSHTAANADWETGDLVHPGELFEFLTAQFGVFGPIPFALLLALPIIGLRKGLDSQDRTLLWLAAVPLVVVAAQAFLSRANANWAAAYMPPASVLLGAWLHRRRAKRTLAATAAVQGAFGVVLAVGAVSPAAADALGLSNSLKRTRGWADTASAVVARAEAEQQRGLTAIAADDRFLFYSLAYYGRDWFASPGAPPLRMWVREASAQNQAEAEAPLTPAYGRRALAVVMGRENRATFAADFTHASGAQEVSVRLDPKRTRDLQLFVGEGFAPKPRVNRPTGP